MIQAVEIEIGEELAGQVADGEPVVPFEGGEEGIPWKILQEDFLGAAGVDD